MMVLTNPTTLKQLGVMTPQIHIMSPAENRLSFVRKFLVIFLFFLVAIPGWLVSSNPGVWRIYSRNCTKLKGPIEFLLKL